MRAIYCRILYRVKTELSPRYTNFITALQFLRSFVSSWSDLYSRWSGSRIKVSGSCARDATSRGVSLARVRFFLPRKRRVDFYEGGKCPISQGLDKNGFFLFFISFFRKGKHPSFLRCITLLIFFSPTAMMDTPRVSEYSPSIAFPLNRSIILSPPPPFYFSINLKIRVKFSVKIR